MWFNLNQADEIGESPSQPRRCSRSLHAECQDYVGSWDTDFRPKEQRTLPSPAFNVQKVTRTLINSLSTPVTPGLEWTSRYGLSDGNKKLPVWYYIFQTSIHTSIPRRNMPSILRWITSHLNGKSETSGPELHGNLTQFNEIGLTPDILKSGVEALRSYKVPIPDGNSTIVDRTTPPTTALPLLAAISQSNYTNDVNYLRNLLAPYEFEIREIRREHHHGWLSLGKHNDGHEKNDVAPYARIWFVKLDDIEYRHQGNPIGGFVDMGTWTGGLMIVSFTGSTTGQDWLDDARAFTHTAASFLHPDFDTLNAHHGFADWLNRRLDTTAKFTTKGAGNAETTVYNAVLSAIADIRRGLKQDPAKNGQIKMITVGHSLGGAVGSLFSLRLSATSSYPEQHLTHDYFCLEGNPYHADNNHTQEPDPRVMPARLALTVTFGAPRFLWQGLDNDQAILEKQREQERRDRDRRIEQERLEEEQAGHPIQRGFRPDTVKWPAHLENVPIVRIVNSRDPVPHVPAGKGELPTGLNVLSVTQVPGDVALLNSHGPQAGEGSKTDGISIPQHTEGAAYVHLGHQWVLDGDKMKQVPTDSDEYISGVWRVFKDFVTHSPYNDNIAKQHSMSTYLRNVTAVYKRSIADK
ncbi:hypothetical protein BDZ94DRAFT_1256617 [Collybia nuda]|uniref:Fungal lipase-type domain-containing protein n=1 Tax=Collybia nuda TaxID=64659 RepID=A0A9P5YAC7_9AGAR|nr:hypothetical protein BDZ94DRAFT_1256617 [Collybia nuda]